MFSGKQWSRLWEARNGSAYSPAEAVHGWFVWLRGTWCLRQLLEWQEVSCVQVNGQRGAGKVVAASRGTRRCKRKDGFGGLQIGYGASQVERAGAGGPTGWSGGCVGWGNASAEGCTSLPQAPRVGMQERLGARKGKWGSVERRQKWFREVSQGDGWGLLGSNVE